MSGEFENNALRIPNYGIYGDEWLTSCFNASAPSTSLRYPLDTRLRSFLGQFGRGSRHSNVCVTAVGPRLPYRIQSLYCVRQAESVAYRGGLGCSNPPEIPKTLQNHAKLNPIVKTVKSC